MKNKHLTQGITLIEILIAFALSSIVFIVVSSLLATIFLSNTKSKRQERFEGVKNTIFSELSNSIRWGKVVVVDSGNSQLRVDANNYQLDGGRLTRNGEALTPNSVEVTEFTLKEFMTVEPDPEIVPPDPRAGHSALPGVKISIRMRDGNDGLTTDTLELFVAQRQTEIDK